MKTGCNVQRKVRLTTHLFSDNYGIIELKSPNQADFEEERDKPNAAEDLNFGKKLASLV